MVFVRWRMLFGAYILFVVALTLSIVAQLAFKVDLGNWYWVIVGIPLVMVWRLSPPYKRYQQKIEWITHTPNDPDAKNGVMVFVGLGNSYHITCTGFDEKRGARFHVTKYVYRFTELNGIEQSSENLGVHFLRGTPSENSIGMHSGYLSILKIAPNGIISTVCHIEEISARDVGVMITMGGIDEHGVIRAMIVTITKKPGIFDFGLLPWKETT